MTSEPKPEAAAVTPTEARVAVLVELRGDFRPAHRLAVHNVLGRSPECSVWVMDPLASRRHAEINQNSSGDFEITDLKSTFGTFVNKSKISAHVLAPGDEIFLGASAFRFELRAEGEDGPRRYQNRLHCQIAARVTFRDKTVATVATDLSLGGLRLEWSEPLELGTEVEVELEVPGREEPVRQRAQANHWSDDAGLGVRFVFASEQEERRLAEAYAQIYLRLDPNGTAGEP